MAAILALLVMISGWFYMFYSRAAHDLASIEEEKRNRRRIYMRRINGFAMLLLGILIFAGTYSIDSEHPGGSYLVIWSAVTILLLIVVILAMADLLLTLKLRRERTRIDP